MQIENLIGNYQAFFSDLLNRLKHAGMSINQIPMSHLLYRTATLPEYESLYDQIKLLCSEFVETQFNGRAVSICFIFYAFAFKIITAKQNV